MAELFDEIRGEFRADQAKLFARRYGWIAAAAVLIVLLGLGAWQYHAGRQQHVDAQAAAALLEQMQHADAPGGPHAGVLPALGALADGTTPDVYRVLAGLRAAAIRAETGTLAPALAQWDAIANDAAAPALLRDLATLLSVQHQVGRGEPNALVARLGRIEVAGNPWRPLAEETQALVELAAGQQRQAVELLTQLQTEPEAQEGVRGRARALLQALGAEPAEGLAEASTQQGNGR